MTKHAVISARIDADLLAKLDRIAAFNERSRAWVISRLLESAATKELEFVDFIQVGLDDIAAGRVVPHEQVVAEIEARIAGRKAA
ncbi:MAG: CopG family ribbon-helix-helix protein [Sphingopyxis sp.]|jgi:predicted transcriptional regulator|uniref:CopG family ribbon-helix-helix protein n=1 Tax=Sphingopyxis sp. TaxID=1908224 RepID=UPI003D6D1890